MQFLSSKSKPLKTNRSPKISEQPNWKLLQFAENYRPCYYGTVEPIHHNSKKLRNPFKQFDSLDYENDSELEWEEEEELGEELLSENEESDEEVEAEDEQDVKLLIGMVGTSWIFE